MIASESNPIDVAIPQADLTFPNSQNEHLGHFSEMPTNSCQSGVRSSFQTADQQSEMHALLHDRSGGTPRMASTTF